MAAWEIYYWVIGSLVCFEGLVAICYFIFFAITKVEASEGLRLIAGAVWCLTVILLIVAIVLAAKNS